MVLKKVLSNDNGKDELLNEKINQEGGQGQFNAFFCGTPLHFVKNSMHPCSNQAHDQPAARKF
jgi:hypothetical protein